MNLNNKSFTFVEIMVYVGVLAVIIAAVASFIIWTINSNSKSRVMREALSNSRRVIERMTSEIKEAKEIYLPTSVFDFHPGQLSLKTSKYLPTGEKITYLDFYICSNRLCLKKESQNPITLTSDKVKVTNLVFHQIDTTVPSIQIDLTIEFDDSSGRPERQALVETITTASLRRY